MGNLSAAGGYDLQTATQLWPPVSLAAMATNTVRTPYMLENTIVVVNHDPNNNGALFGIDRASGTLAWTKSVSAGDLPSTPMSDCGCVLDGDVLLFACADGKILSVDGNGNLGPVVHTTLPNPERLIAAEGMFLVVAGNQLIGYRSTAPSFSPYGTSCAGTPPPTTTLASLNLPRIGQTFQMSIGPIAPSSNAYLFIGFGVDNVSLAPIGAPSCSIYVSSPVPFMIPNPNMATMLTYNLAIPPLPIFIGGTFYTQVALTDPSANPLGVTTTHAAAVRIGP